MGKLDKYARQSRSKEASKVLPIRLPEGIYEQFRERCDELGLSMSEAGYLLIRLLEKSTRDGSHYYSVYTCV